MFKFLTKQNIATLFLVLMCIQYVPLEGTGVSYVKFGAMCFSPLIWLICSPKITKAFIWGMLYFAMILFSGLFHYSTFRLSTIGYLFSFICMFIMFYNLIYCERAFSLDYFIKLLKNFILAYTICLLIQQAFIIVGIKIFSPINLVNTLNRGIGAQSLSLEPSHSARIMTVLFLAFLRMYEVKWGRENVTITKIYQDARWVVLGFLWSMLTMGSGTAFVGLGILSLYFIKRQYALTIVPLLIVLYLVIPYIKFEPLQRAKVTFEAALTLDQEEVIKADGSAAIRVNPLINTFTDMNFSSSETWFGKGTVSEVQKKTWYKEKSKIGNIDQYGLLSFFIGLILLFSCCFYKVFSLETLLCFVLLGLTINNFSYIWGCYMILVPVKYFYLTQKKPIPIHE